MSEFSFFIKPLHNFFYFFFLNRMKNMQVKIWTSILKLTMLWPNSADDKLIFFLLLEKKDLTFHANCLIRRQFA